MAQAIVEAWRFVNHLGFARTVDTVTVVGITVIGGNSLFLEVPIIGRILLRYFTMSVWILTSILVVLQYEGWILISVESLFWGWLAVYCVAFLSALHKWTAPVSRSRSDYIRGMVSGVLILGIPASLLATLWAAGTVILAILSAGVYTVITGFQADILRIWIALFLLSLLSTELYISFRIRPSF